MNPMKTVSMNNEGRITVPADARRSLGIEGAAEFEIEVDGDSDAIILRPVVTIRREDAWAFSEEHSARLKRAVADANAGRTRRASEDDLQALMGSVDA